ncbi:MAG: hypothetical protein IPI48_14145 [bacterium]|nr:hypothetical protein [bacterium]
MIPAIWNGMILNTYPTYIAHVADLVAPTNPEWSDWQPYGATEEERSCLYPGLNHGGIYLFAVQVRDAAGRVSTITDYNPRGGEVLWMRAVSQHRPRYLGCEETRGDRTRSIDPGQVVAFYWWADARDYNGMIASCRHGWDLLDPNDPLDPGWAVEPGLDPANLATEPISFATGEHVLTIRVIDDFGQVGNRVWLGGHAGRKIAGRGPERTPRRSGRNEHFIPPLSAVGSNSGHIYP